MDKEIKRVLRKYGLSDNEIIVYTEALNLMETSPYELSKLTNIPRTTVYDVITDLSLKGLLELETSDGYTKQQTKIKATNPSILRKKIRNKHKDLYNLEVDLVGILPMLKKDFQKSDSNSDFQFFPGVEGALKIYKMEIEFANDIETFVIQQLTPMDAFGTEEINSDVLKENELRSKTGKRVYELVPLDEWTKHIITYQVATNPGYLDVRNYRYIDNPIFEQYQRLAIAGETIFITNTEGDEAFGLKIRSRGMTKSFKSIFDLLWLQATPITLDIVKSWGDNQYYNAEQSKRKNK